MQRLSNLLSKNTLPAMFSSSGKVHAEIIKFVIKEHTASNVQLIRKSTCRDYQICYQRTHCQRCSAHQEKYMQRLSNLLSKNTLPAMFSSSGKVHTEIIKFVIKEHTASSVQLIRKSTLRDYQICYQRTHCQRCSAHQEKYTQRLSNLLSKNTLPAMFSSSGKVHAEIIKFVIKEHTASDVQLIRKSTRRDYQICHQRTHCQQCSAHQEKYMQRLSNLLSKNTLPAMFSSSGKVHTEIIKFVIKEHTASSVQLIRKSTLRDYQICYQRTHCQRCSAHQEKYTQRLSNLLSKNTLPAMFSSSGKVHAEIIKFVIKEHTASDVQLIRKSTRRDYQICHQRTHCQQCSAHQEKYMQRLSNLLSKNTLPAMFSSSGKVHAEIIKFVIKEHTASNVQLIRKSTRRDYQICYQRTHCQQCSVHQEKYTQRLSNCYQRTHCQQCSAHQEKYTQRLSNLLSKNTLPAMFSSSGKVHAEVIKFVIKEHTASNVQLIRKITHRDYQICYQRTHCQQCSAHQEKYTQRLSNLLSKNTLPAMFSSSGKVHGEITKCVMKEHTASNVQLIRKSTTNLQGVLKSRVLKKGITPEIFDLESQFRYFCKAGACSYLTG